MIVKTQIQTTSESDFKRSTSGVSRSTLELDDMIWGGNSRFQILPLMRQVNIVFAGTHVLTQSTDLLALFLPAKLED